MTPRITVPRLVLGALLGVCLGALVWGPQLLRRLELFRIERAEVSGVQLLAPHEVLAASGVRRGQSVWDDPGPWLAALRAHPVVREAAVERALPRTLRIRIDEHRPVALVEAGTLRPATAEGVILPVDPARVAMDLPLVRVAAPAGSDRVEDADARSLLAETARLARLDPALAARVSEVRRAASGDLLLRLAHPGIELVLSAGTGPEQLRRLRAVLEDVARRAVDAEGKQIRVHPPVRVDARFLDQVVVRFP